MGPTTNQMDFKVYTYTQMEVLGFDYCVQSTSQLIHGLTGIGIKVFNLKFMKYMDLKPAPNS